MLKSEYVEKVNSLLEQIGDLTLKSSHEIERTDGFRVRARPFRRVGDDGGAVYHMQAAVLDANGRAVLDWQGLPDEVISDFMLYRRYADRWNAGGEFGEG